MDRAVVYPEEKTSESEFELVDRYRFLMNVPFEFIPRPFIESLRDRSFSYEEFLELAPVMNRLENYWNIILMDHKEQMVKLIAWGCYDPLEKLMMIMRISAHPGVMKSGMIRHQFGLKLFNTIKAFGNSLGMKRLIWISEQADAWVRKLDGEAFIANAKVIEAY